MDALDEPPPDSVRRRHRGDGAARKHAIETLRPSHCYAVVDVQQQLGISASVIIEAVSTGDIPRSLGYGLEMHVLGIDLVDWLQGRPLVWPGRRAAEVADEFTLAD